MIRGCAVIAAFFALSGVSKAQWGDAATQPKYVAPPGPYSQVAGDTFPFNNSYITGNNGPYIIGGGFAYSFSATDGVDHMSSMKNAATIITSGGRNITISGTLTFTPPLPTGSTIKLNYTAQTQTGPVIQTVVCTVK
jgi:hypothetical protein